MIDNGSLGSLKPNQRLIIEGIDSPPIRNASTLVNAALNHPHIPGVAHDKLHIFTPEVRTSTPYSPVEQGLANQRICLSLNQSPGPFTSETSNRGRVQGGVLEEPEFSTPALQVQQIPQGSQRILQPRSTDRLTTSPSKKQFPCQSCERSYSYRQSRRAHMIAEHGESKRKAGRPPTCSRPL